MAALADLAGGNGWALLSERDPVLAEIRQAVATRAADIVDERLKRLAVYLSRAMAGKQP